MLEIIAYLAPSLRGWPSTSLRIDDGRAIFYQLGNACRVPAIHANEIDESVGTPITRFKHVSDEPDRIRILRAVLVQLLGGFAGDQLSRGSVLTRGAWPTTLRPMSRFVGAVLRGVLLGFVAWYVIANTARTIGRAIGPNLLRGRWRKRANLFRREAHDRLASGLLLSGVVASVAKEFTGSLLPLSLVSPLAVSLFAIELLLGGAHRRPEWNPTAVFRDLCGSVGTVLDQILGTRGIAEVGSVADKVRRQPTAPGAAKHRCGRLTSSGGRCRNPVSAPGQRCRFHT